MLLMSRGLALLSHNCGTRRCSCALANYQELLQLGVNRMQPVHDGFVQFGLKIELMDLTCPGETI